MNTFAIGSLPVHFSVAKLFNFRWQYTSDQEILTIYLFIGSEQRYTRIKEIHSFAKEYLLDWFPGLCILPDFRLSPE